jgi:hypothetical protein
MVSTALIRLTGAGALLAILLTPGALLAQMMSMPSRPGAPSPGADAPQGPIDPWWRPPTEPNGASNPNGLPQCLRARTLSGVVASNDREVILRFGRDSFYRVRLAKACPSLVAPGSHVVGVARSSDGDICDSRDLDLRIASSDGSTSSCRADRLSKMSTAEVTAASAPAQP